MSSKTDGQDQGGISCRLCPLRRRQPSGMRSQETCGGTCLTACQDPEHGTRVSRCPLWPPNTCPSLSYSARCLLTRVSSFARSQQGLQGQGLHRKPGFSHRPRAPSPRPGPPPMWPRRLQLGLPGRGKRQQAPKGDE